MRVLKPESEADVAAMVAEAAAAKRALSIEGGGSKRGLGRVAEPSDVLKLNALSGIVSYEPEELVVTVKAGTPLRDIEAALAEKNQCLAFEPGRWSFDRNAVATIGGTIAAGVAGSRRVVLGGARDHIIGFRAVNGEGNVFKAGGKVVKNVTGYDLPKLAAGSFGTLFVMTELTLRTYPHTQTPVSVFVPNLDIERACSAMRGIAGSPFEATGFCYLPRVALERLKFDGVQSLTVIRFEGGIESMRARAESCAKSLPGAVVGDDERSRQVWLQIRDLNAFESSSVLWRVSIPPSNAAGLLAALRPDCFAIDWAGGLAWVETARGDVHDVARSFGGHALLFRGPDEMRRGAVFQPLDPVTEALTRRLKAAFDPHGVFSPGRMYDGI